MIIRLTVTHENSDEVSVETNSPAGARAFLILCDRPGSHVHIDIEDSLDSPNDAYQYLDALGLALQHFPIAKLPKRSE